MEGRGGEGREECKVELYMQLFLLHQSGTLRLTCALREEGSMAYRCPSFGPSDESHMCEYDISMTGITSVPSRHKDGSWTQE